MEEITIEKEAEIDSMVKEIVKGLILSVCRSSSDGRDASERCPAPTAVVVDEINTESTSTEGPQGDCAKVVIDKVS